jgi:proline-specific peptidase
MPAAGEGFAELSGGRVFYDVQGSGDATPLVLLHGGPAGGSDYMRPIARMFSDERPVVLYDQLGCGKSDQPDDPSLWRIDRFASELAELRVALGLERVHLLGQSFGGMLAIEYLLGGPDGVASVTLADTTASMPQAITGMARLRAELPDDVRAALDAGEAAGELETPEYGMALFAFYQRNLCRLEVWPDELMAMGASMMNNPVYLQMWGPNEFVATGNLLDWDRSERLAEIDVPALVTVGRYGELTPDCAETIHAGIAGSELVLFEESAHVPHFEEPERFESAVGGFIRRSD